MPTEVNNSPAGDATRSTANVFTRRLPAIGSGDGPPGNLAPRASMPKRAGVKHDPWRRITLIPWKGTLGYR